MQPETQLAIGVPNRIGTLLGERHRQPILFVVAVCKADGEKAARTLNNYFKVKTLLATLFSVPCHSLLSLSCDLSCRWELTVIVAGTTIMVGAGIGSWPPVTPWSFLRTERAVVGEPEVNSPHFRLK